MNSEDIEAYFHTACASFISDPIKEYGEDGIRNSAREYCFQLGYLAALLETWRNIVPGHHVDPTYVQCVAMLEAP